MKTDFELQQDVSAELEWDPAVHGARIGVEVSDGVVTLVGDLPTYAEKWAAERAAQRVAGVKALATSLKVQLTGPRRHSDADIAHAAENVLDWNATLPAGAVKLMVEGGWVTLTGEVDWHYQRQAAVASVRHLLGVTGVTDRIALKPAVEPEAVRADIEAALRRQAAVDAGGITVAVDGGEVTLSGLVHSWHERNAATHSAWGTPGVRNVIDHLQLAP